MHLLHLFLAFTDYLTTNILAILSLITLHTIFKPSFICFVYFNRKLSFLLDIFSTIITVNMKKIQFCYVTATNITQANQSSASVADKSVFKANANLLIATRTGYARRITNFVWLGLKSDAMRNNSI